MTINEAISRANELKPNDYTDNQKIEWLSKLDGRIKSDIIDTHEGYEDISFSDYNKDTDTSTELLVPSPYDDIYTLWLQTQIDYNNAEFTKYNNSVSMFNVEYEEYAKHYNRTHTPLSEKFKYV